MAWILITSYQKNYYIASNLNFMIDIDIQQELQYELIDDEKSDRNGNIIFSQGDFVFGMISGMIWQGMGTRVVHVSNSSEMSEMFTTSYSNC
jgi:hypothetical protein